MTPGQLISIIAVLFGLVLALVGLIYRGLDKRVCDLEAHEKTDLLLVSVENLGKEFAKLEGRFDQWSKDDREFHYNWRHNSYAPTINEINAQLWPLPKQIEDMQGRISGIERALFEQRRERLENELRNPQQRP